jgi:hypothetical protein
MPAPAEEKAELADDTGKITERLDKLDALDLDEANKADFAALRQTFQQYVAGIAAVVDAAVANQPLAQRRFEEIQKANDATDSAIEGLSDKLDADVAAAEHDLKATHNTLQAAVVVTLLIGVVLVVGGTVFLSRSATRRIRAGRRRHRAARRGRPPAPRAGRAAATRSRRWRGAELRGEQFTRVFSAINDASSRLAASSASLHRRRRSGGCVGG